MASTRSPSIPSFYRIWFTWVDPLVSLITVGMAWFAPKMLVNSAIPESISPFDPYQTPVIHMIGGLFFFLVVIGAVLLRNTSDIHLWKIVQGGILGTDISILVGFFYGLRQQDRMETAFWRSDDWMNLAITVWVTVLRLAFITEIGFPKSTATKKKL